MFKFETNAEDIGFTQAFTGRTDKLIDALTDKMTYLMQALQDKMVSQYLSATDGPDVTLLEELREGTGALADSVHAQEATFSDGFVEGEVIYGGNGTWAELIEKGGSGFYVINPIGSKESGGSRKHEKGAKREYGQDYLKWADVSGRFGDMTIDGWAYARSVMHPPMKARPFAELALESMKEEIRDGLYEAILGAMEI